jgi:hypothetical protein
MSTGSVRLASLAFLLLAMWTCKASAAGDARASLSPKWLPGYAMYIEWEWETKETWKGDGLPEGGREIKTTQTFGFLHRVDAVIRGKMVQITLTFDHVAMSIDTPDTHLSFDSDKDNPDDTTNALGTVLGPMLGMALTMEVDKEGRVLGVWGMKKIREKIAASKYDKDAYEYVRDALDNQAQQFIWDQFYALYAYKYVEAGDSWTRDIKSRRRLFNCKYTVDHIDEEDSRRTALLSYTATGRSLPESEAQKTAGETQFEYGPARSEGGATFDTWRGEFIEGHETGRAEASAAKPDPKGGAPMKAKITKNVTQSFFVLDSKERRALKRE